MGNTDFEFRSLADGQTISPDQISSGESKAVALAAEILYFFDTIDPAKFNIILLDEPDVHPHPDLQARLGKLIIAMLDEFKNYADSIVVCLSTQAPRWSVLSLLHYMCRSAPRTSRSTQSN